MRWAIKSGKDRQADYVAMVDLDARRLVWGLRDEALKFDDHPAAILALDLARQQRPKSGARIVRLIRVTDEWAQMREAIASVDASIAKLEATVALLAASLGVNPKEDPHG